MLPITQHPIFKITIPSTKKEEFFRPFVVKEEKILLMAKESEKQSDIMLAIKQIIKNCATNTEFDIDDLTLFDLDYIFIKLRAASVNEIVPVVYTDAEDNQDYNLSINLNLVEVTNTDVSNKIVIDKETVMTMKYPKASLYEDEELLNSDKDSLFKLIVRCIDKIYKGEEVYDASTYSYKEVEEFVDSLPINVFSEIKTFMISQPTVYYKLTYKNSLGNNREIVLSKLEDFFEL